MNRRPFLTTLLAAAPVAALAKYLPTIMRTDKGFTVKSGQARFVE